MKIAVVGTGYVGLVSGACFAEFGVDVVCVDTDTAKIKRLQQGEIPIYEPGLDDLVAKQTKAGRLCFTTDLGEAMVDADAVFIAVGTPTRKVDGHADLTYVHDAARDIAKHIRGYVVVVNKSTVPVGTARAVAKTITEARPDADFDVVSNPEFLREGSAINDFMRPDRVVIGADSARAAEVMKNLYRPLFLNETPMSFMSPESAEITKYAANAFLATKITFINEIANLCEAAGGDVQHVAKAIGLDGRIGSKFLHAGPGYGGSCFPKDTLAFTQIGRAYNTPQRIVEAVVDINADRQQSMAYKIVTACGGSVKNLKIGILGIAFKPNTDDVREAPSLVIIPLLQQFGAHISAHDPIARTQAEKELKNIDWQDDPYAVAKGADALVIITEWNEYRALDLDRLADIMKTRRLIDLRNIYKPAEVEQAGFDYVSIGRAAVMASKKQTLKKVS
ncbi:MAG: UDP-glucose/GDP-mannose dehydrogenase family protein [Alphaproteobacteria bacterium]|nr:UDP-glucose/GDP-mannose dehydrogenase family protein [Alphaproteobacteria bacterium]